MAEIFEIVVFTAAQQDYADFILNLLDKSGSLITHRLYRQHCQSDGVSIIKDLTRLGRPLSRTIIVDNLKENFKRQPKNGVEILTWT
jgi:CTD small phosphatase-like protein 2